MVRKGKYGNKFRIRAIKEWLEKENIKVKLRIRDIKEWLEKENIKIKLRIEDRWNRRLIRKIWKQSCESEKDKTEDQGGKYGNEIQNQR